MKPEKLCFSILLLFLVIGFLSCSRSGLDLEQNPDDFLELIVNGRVLDEAGNPLQGAKLAINKREIESATDGSFSLKNNQEIDSLHLNVSKEGYFTTSRTLQLTGAGKTDLVLRMIKKPEPFELSGDIGGIVDIGSGVQLDFPLNAIVSKKDGTTYSGKVRVYAKSFSRDHPNFDELLPGGITGQLAGETVALEAYSCLMVELFDEADKPLQIATGKKVQVRLALPSSLGISLTEKLNSWHFKEDKFLWENKGEVDRDNNTFTFYADSFSSWSIGRRTDLGEITVFAFRNDGTPYTDCKISIQDFTTNQKLNIYPDRYGKARARYPLNREIAISLVDYGNNILNNPHKIILRGKLYVATRHSSKVKRDVIRVRGMAISCDSGEPIKWGAVEVQQNSNFQYFTFKDGVFDFYLPQSGIYQHPSIAIKLIDFQTGKSELVFNQFNVSSNDILLGSNKICTPDDSLSYVRYRFGDSTYLLYDKRDTLVMNRLGQSQNNAYEFVFKDMTLKHQVRIQVKDITSSSQKFITASVWDNWQDPNLLGVILSNQDESNITVTEIGEIGERISGRFSAQMRMKIPGQFIPVEGIFSFKRRN
jgi:hypothetical protein